MNESSTVKIDISASGGNLKQVTQEAKGDLQSLGKGHDELTAAAARGRSIAVEFIKGLAGYDALKQAASLVVNLTKEMAVLSARHETLGIVMQVVGRNVGATNAEMEAQAESVRKMGITMLESRQSVISLAQADIELSNASKLARVAQDAAVIGNVNSSQALQKLVYGIQSAQTDVLRTIGINVNFEQSYRRVAKQLGKNVEDLSETEKIQARVNAVLEAGTRIVGSYEAAMGTAGKQMTSLARYAEDLKVLTGEVFNDALVIAVNSYTSALKDSGDASRKLRDDASLKEWGRDAIRTLAFLGDELKLIKALVTEVVTPIERVGRNIYTLGAAASIVGGRGSIGEKKQALEQLAQESKAYYKALDARLAANRNVKSFSSSAEEFFGEKDAQDRERALQRAEDDRDTAMARIAGVVPKKSAQGGNGKKKRIPGYGESEQRTENLRAAQQAATAELKATHDRDEMWERSAKKRAEVEEAAEERANVREAQLKREAQAVKDAINPWQAYRNELTQLFTLYDAGKLTLAEYEAAIASAREKTERSTGAMKDSGAEQFEALQRSVEGFGRATSRSLAQMAVDGKLSFEDLGQAARNFALELIEIQIQKRLMDPWIKAGTSALDKLFNPRTPSFPDNDAGYSLPAVYATEQHAGGMAGSGPRRYVHPAYFERARRMHSGGLAGDEVATVLKRNEEVLTRRDPRHVMNGGGAPTVILNITTPAGRPMQAEVSKPVFDGRAVVLGIVMSELQNNSDFRQAVAAAGQAPA